MGRYWALGALSLILKLLGVLLFVTYIAFLVAMSINSLTPPQAAPVSPQFSPFPGGVIVAPPGMLTSQPVVLSAADLFAYQIIYFIAVGILIFAIIGWPLTALIFYAAGQWIDLHINTEFNTRRVADHTAAVQRRRVIPPAQPEDW